MDTPSLLSSGEFFLRFSTDGDIHATLDAIRAEIDRWDTRLMRTPPAQDSCGPGHPSSDIPSSPLS